MSRLTKLKYELTISEACRYLSELLDQREVLVTEIFQLTTVRLNVEQIQLVRNHVVLQNMRGVEKGLV